MGIGLTDGIFIDVHETGDDDRELVLMLNGFVSVFPLSFLFGSPTCVRLNSSMD